MRGPDPDEPTPGAPSEYSRSGISPKLLPLLYLKTHPRAVAIESERNPRPSLVLVKTKSAAARAEPTG